MRMLLLPGVFRPRSDSVLLAETVGGLCSPGMRMLDVCTGSGLVAVAAAQAGARAAAVDISRRAVLNARLNGILNGVKVHSRRSDLFGSLQGQRFDLIASNPPYLPGTAAAGETTGPARAWEGGPDGRELLDHLIDDAFEHLNPGGQLLVIHSSLCGFDRTCARMVDAGLEPNRITGYRGPLGPIMAARAERLEATGVLEPGVREEEVAIISGRRPVCDTRLQGKQ